MEPQNNPTTPTEPTAVTAPPPTVITPNNPNAALPPETPTSLPTPTTSVNVPPAPSVLPTSPLAVTSGSGLPPVSSSLSNSPVKRFGPFVAVALLILGVGGYIFGFYLPNQPDNVWQTGLKNSGKALESVVSDLTTEERLEKLSKTEVTATLEASGSGYDVSGNLSSRFDEKKSTSSLKLNSEGSTAEKINLTVDMVTELKDKKVFPDLYFKVGGLDSFGEESLFSLFSVYNNKWISVSSDYLEQAYAESGEPTPTSNEAINSGDVADFVKVVSDTSNEYLFSTNKDKAVLENRKYLGKEKIDDVNTFHYEVGVNKDRAAAYCTVLTQRVADTSLAKKAYATDTEGLKKMKDDAEKDCKKSAEELVKDGDTFEAWVNTKYKIMHKVRFYEPKDKTIYTEFGQIYKGGKSLSLFMNYHDEGEKSDAKLTLDLDPKTITSKGTMTITQKGDNGYDVKVNLEIKPAEGEVKVDIPTDAVPIETIMNELGAGDVYGTSSFRDLTDDTPDAERRTDINALHLKLEAYKATSGSYPALADLNTASWRQTNLNGLDESVLTDPAGSSPTLGASATATQYGYTATGCVARKCKGYTVGAILTSGVVFKKTNL